MFSQWRQGSRYLLSQSCAAELCVMDDGSVLCLCCPIWYPQAGSEHFRCDQCDWGTAVFILFNISSFKCKFSRAAGGWYCTEWMQNVGPCGHRLCSVQTLVSRPTLYSRHVEFFMHKCLWMNKWIWEKFLSFKSYDVSASFTLFHIITSVT